MKKLATLILIALFANAKAQEIPDYQNPAKDIETRIDDALRRMTLAEKVAICHAQGKFYSNGVPRLGIPGLWMSDGPHGVRAEMDWKQWRQSGWEIDSCTAFPSLTCLAATWNPDMAMKYGMAIGEEAAYRGKNVLLGPGVNIYRTPLNGRNFEYMGEDPLLSASMCAPYIKGVQKNGVSACVKHFALNNQEWGRWSINVEVSERALRELYLPAFKAAVQQGGAWSLMGSYNKLRGTHCSHNDYLLNKILKNEWEFDGVVMSDWDATHNLNEAIYNGLDIEMGTSQRPDKGIKWDKFTFNDSYLANDFLKALQNGEVPEEIVNEKARRVLRLIFRTSYNPVRHTGNMDYEGHAAVCREIGAEGIVLLQNNKVDNLKQPLLPLSSWLKPEHTIMLVGDNAIRRLTLNGGSSELKAQHETSALEAFQRLFGDNVIHNQGYWVEPDNNAKHDEWLENNAASRTQAVLMARTVDLVVFVGGLNKDRFQDCEDSDRKSYDLPYEQAQLIEELAEVNPNIVCVIMSGNAVQMDWADKVPAIIQAWYLGSETGNALLDVLMGNVNPSGKLPFSIPFKLEDCAAHSFGEIAYPGNGKQVEYKEDILVGYRWHDTKNIPARFAFGHGLSYTSFKYSDAKMRNDSGKWIVSLKVKNTGKMTGKEVVQLYVGKEDSSIPRAKKELKAFRKIELQPGEEKTVEFAINPQNDLQYYDESTNSWKTENGKYTIYIGSSSTDIKSTIKASL